MDGTNELCNKKEQKQRRALHEGDHKGGKTILVQTGCRILFGFFFTKMNDIRHTVVSLSPCACHKKPTRRFAHGSVFTSVPFSPFLTASKCRYRLSMHTKHIPLSPSFQQEQARERERCTSNESKKTVPYAQCYATMCVYYHAPRLLGGSKTSNT